MNENQALKLVPDVVSEALVPVSRPSNTAGTYDVGYQWALSPGNNVVLSGELTVPVANISTAPNAFKATLDALNDMFASVRNHNAQARTPNREVASDVGVVGTAPAQTAPAQTAAPGTPVAAAPKRRGRPPGSASAAAAPAQPAPQPAPQASPEPESEPDPTQGADGFDEPGNLEPDEPRGKSGRTLSQLMALKILVGKEGGTMRGNTYAGFQKMSEERNAAKNVDDVLDFIINHQFRPGDGLHDPATIVQCGQEANELCELRKKLGIYKPKSAAK